MLILDASVAAKLFIAEADSDRAEQVLALGEPLIAPDLVLVEVANALHKAWRREIVDDVQMDRALRKLPTIFGRLFPAADLVANAAIISRILRHPVPDCVYIALHGGRVRLSLQPTWSLSKPPMPCRLGPAARFA